MPQLEHIDISHLLYKLALLIELGVTSKEHAQALAFLSVGEQQNKRVLIALAIHRVKRPHHTSPKCADIDRVSASHLPIRYTRAIQDLSRRAVKCIGRDRNGSNRKTIEYVGKTAPMVFVPMRHEDGVDMVDVIANQRRHHAVIEPTVDECHGATLTNQNRIGLANIEDRYRRRRTSLEGEQANTAMTQALVDAFTELRVATVLMHGIVPAGCELICEYFDVDPVAFFSWDNIFASTDEFVESLGEKPGEHRVKPLPPRFDFFSKHESQY